MQFKYLAFAKDFLNVALSYELMKCKTKLGRDNMELQQLQQLQCKKIKYCLNVTSSYEVQDQAWAEQYGVATIATDHPTETHPRCLTDYINHSIRFLHKHQNPLITHSLIS